MHCDAARLACAVVFLAFVFLILSPGTASACSATRSFSALNTSQTVNIQSCSTYYNPTTGDLLTPNRWSGLASSLNARMRSASFCQIGAVGTSSGNCDPSPTTVTTSNATYSFSADLMGTDTFTITLVTKTATPAVTDTLTLYSFVGAATASLAQARANTAYVFTFNLPDTGVAAVPTVTGLSPNSGTAAGGSTITITGTNFTGATDVKFGSTSATFSITDATSIQATAPSGAVGTVDVTVTSPGGTSAAGAADQFTYTATGPTLTGASPASGPAAGGTSVTLSGTNLTGATAVSFGGTAATSFSVTSASAITAVAPAHAAGPVTVSVTTPGGTVTLASGFTYAVPAPVAGAVSATIAANSSANPISLSLSGGAATAVAVASQPGRGTATASGTSITYTPHPGSFGSDSFTYTATNASGTSAPAPVTLTIAPPTIRLAPADGALPGATAGARYSQSLAASGGTAPYTYAVTAGSLPAGVTLDASTGGLTGTPTAASNASFTVSATDAHRFSGSAVYMLVVVRPTLTLTPIAGALPFATVGTPYGQIFAASGGTAPYTYTVTSGSLPAGLTLAAATGTLSGTPVQTGQASFTVTGTDTTGATGATAYTVAVKATPVVAVSSTRTIVAGTANTVDLTVGATGGPFTDARLISLSPATAGSALVILGETAANDNLVVTQIVGARRYRLKFTPSPTFSGRAVATFTLSNSTGTSAPATITFVVNPRPDPSKDAEVLGLMHAQAQAAQRFATDQMANFNDRLERLHDARCHSGSWGISLNDSRGLATRNDAAELARARNAPLGGIANGAPGPLRAGLTDPRALSRLADPTLASGHEDTLRSASDGSSLADPYRSPSGSGCDADAPTAGTFAFWSSGFVNFGSMDLGSGRGFDFTASSISLGADYRLDPSITAGMGVGFGNDQSRVGMNGTRSDGRSYSAALYGSYHPTPTTFLDALAGYGRLGFDTRRYVTLDPLSDLAVGRRDGYQIFGSITAGYEYRNRAFGFLVSPYARVNASLSTLDGFSETGGSSFALRYGRQNVGLLTSFVGLRGAYDVPLSWGVVTPRVRLEYGHDFAGASSLGLGYADQTGFSHRLVTTPTGRDSLNLGLGTDVQVGDNWAVGIDYRTSFGQTHVQQHSFGVRIGSRF